MKKRSFTVLIYLVVSILASGLVLAAAGAIKIPLLIADNLSPAPSFTNPVPDTLHKGKVIVNYPKGTNSVQFTIVLSGATPNQVYSAYYGPKTGGLSGWFGGLHGNYFDPTWAGLGTITTDGNGDGSLHINVQAASGTYTYHVCICQFTDASLTTHLGCAFVAQVPLSIP